MTPQEIIDRVARSQEVIEFATSPGRAFILIAHLQLALRHPDNHGQSAEFVRQIITNLAMAIAQKTETPELAGMVAQGYHPEFDLTEAEADEYFGERPRPERSLNLSLDLAEDADNEAIGKALAMLMQQTPDPEATFENWQAALAKAKIEPIFPA
ncbi:hypothetical protein IQ265_13690 [Nodosilinea sp. LEGE 06152]|uniref:hypothetical protein n=1 Tax=Nodosilinea sp. LEGE 06152 TaxID=2777966 RepID=UPI001881C7B5|nr:hypothetical protein [Nodosilinea sp. LEGE 06152]MBE9157868.1 hypothetical protein [Nodosilinea sp. LEGE 06152]